MSTTFNLNHYKASNSNEATHLKMGGKFLGKYKIPSEKYYDLYKYVSKNPSECITEKPNDKMKLYFDIDELKNIYNEDLDDNIQVSIEKFVNEVILVEINKVLDIKDAKTELKFYILKNKSKLKFHIHFPNLIVNKERAEEIGRLINQRFENIIDTSVYKTGLRIFNSWKPKKGDPHQSVKNTNYIFLEEMVECSTLKKKMKKVCIKVDDDIELTPLKKGYKLGVIKKNKDKKEEEKKLSELCNKILGTTYNWTAQKKNDSDNTFICYHDNLQCLVKRNHQHTSLQHSCMYINKSGKSTVNCLNGDSHGKEDIPNSEDLKNLKAFLGLIRRKKEQNDFQLLRAKMSQIAKEKNYKRMTGYVMKPVHPDIPIIYEKYKTYKDFINEIFSNLEDKDFYELYRKSSTHHKKLINYLEDFEDADFKFIILNRYVYAFKNGYLNIEDLQNWKFVLYEDMDKNNVPITSVHYNCNFDNNWLKNIDKLKTPIFDQICNYQFQDEQIYEIFLGMIGRLHYPINKYDQFNCMVYIIGGSNTGKSTTGDIIMSNHQNIGTISGKMEDTFGLQSLIEKYIIYVQECPKNIHRRLDKSDLQRMIEASCMDVPRKGLASINDYKWEIPMLWIGNFLPQYLDSSGAIPRRLCIFRMENHVEQRDSSFKKTCLDTERHFILLKTLYYYRELISKFSTKTFEDWGIEYFREGFEKVMTNCNYMYKFLTLAPGDFEYYPQYKKGAELRLNGKNGFKDKYERYLHFQKAPLSEKKYKRDVTTLARQGYQLIEKKLCAGCQTIYSEDNEKCCDDFNKYNLRKQEFIKNMIIKETNPVCDIEMEDSDIEDNED